MHYSLVHLVLAGVAALFLFDGAVKFFKREGRQTLFKVLANFVVWGSILVLALFPGLSHIVSLRLGFGENLNTLIFLGFVVVLIALFKLLNATERLERNISEIVRREALEKLERIQERRGEGSDPRPAPGSTDGPL